MRGVHCVDPLDIVAKLGSSPHARGPQTEDMLNGISGRIIPACAGST